jgi:hypothetical protein
MKLQLFALLFLIVNLSGCAYQSAKFITKTDYRGTEKLKSVFVIMASDKNTQDCMRYYQSFLIDSLKSYNINAEGTFYCCLDKKSDINAIMNSLLAKNKNFQNILTIVLTKTVVGHGASSSRELQIDLFQMGGQGRLWNGKLSTTFDWFISDENYRAVANKVTQTTLMELKEKGIL